MTDIHWLKLCSSPPSDLANVEKPTVQAKHRKVHQPFAYCGCGMKWIQTGTLEEAVSSLQIFLAIYFHPWDTLHCARTRISPLSFPWEKKDFFSIIFPPDQLLSPIQ